jgi:hypothetical protein
MRPQPVDLAVSSAKTHFTHKTRPVKLKIGNTVTTKSLYLLPIPQFDAIVGIPFFKENEIDLAGLEARTIKVNGNKILMTDGDMDMDMEESPESMETPMIGMISRKRLKKELRRDEIEEIYLATIQQTNDDTGIISAQDANDVPDWIQKKYGSVLREELPPRMPPTRSMDHQIPLKLDMPPPFRGIFPLSQLELRKGKRQLDQLLKDGPSTSPYGPPRRST